MHMILYELMQLKLIKKAMILKYWSISMQYKKKKILNDLKLMHLIIKAMILKYWSIPMQYKVKKILKNKVFVQWKELY